MTSRRHALIELSAYRSRRRTPLPRSIRWGHVLVGFALVGLPTGLIIAGIIGWMA
jgi:hypothetical protein